jgi:hypothetical protein
VSRGECHRSRQCHERACDCGRYASRNSRPCACGQPLCEEAGRQDDPQDDRDRGPRIFREKAGQRSAERSPRVDLDSLTRTNAAARDFTSNDDERSAGVIDEARIAREVTRLFEAVHGSTEVARLFGADADAQGVRQTAVVAERGIRGAAIGESLERRNGIVRLAVVKSVGTLRKKLAGTRAFSSRRARRRGGEDNDQGRGAGRDSPLGPREPHAGLSRCLIAS